MFIMRDWFVSKFHRNVQKFIKFANFYRRFVKTFFQIAVDFINLLKKDVKNKFSIKFVMNAETFKFFQNFKNVFTTTFMLRHFVVFFFILIKTNFSKYAFSKIIFQLFEKKQWHSIIYWFRKMTASERNYNVEKQKFFAIVEVCKKWKHYVKNSKFFVRIIIDHVNFRTFLTIKAFSRRETRW